MRTEPTIARDGDLPPRVNAGPGCGLSPKKGRYSTTCTTSVTTGTRAGLALSTFGFHPLLCYLDRPEVSSGEALSGIVRGGGADSNRAKDHIEVLDLALASLPEEAPPREGDPKGSRICVRSDAAGATHDFAAHCRERGVAFFLTG